MRLRRIAWIGLMGFGAVVCDGSYAQSSGEQEVVIPAISFTNQGGGEVHTTSRLDASRRPAPEYVHFWHTPGHWLEWTVEGATPGQYELSLSYAGKHDTERSLAVNGEPVAGLDPFTLARTGRWSTWREVALPAPITLTAGRNVLRMTCLDDASIRLKEIRLSDERGESIEIRAVDLSGQGGGRAHVLISPAQGHVSGWSGEDHWLEWTADAPVAGRYDVYLHYSADGFCPRELRVNGEPVRGLESFIMPFTGDDRHWTVGKLPVAIALKAGQNTLRLTALGGDRRAVPRIDGTLGLSVIRLVSPPGEPAEATGVIGLQDVIAEQERRKQRGAPTPPAPLGPPLPAVEGAVPLLEGQTFALAGRSVTITQADTLPYVENKFSKRFVFENYDNPKVRLLHEKHKLDEVVAPGRDEFEKQLLLMKWVYDQWDFGHARELYMLRDPFWILDEAKREHKFQCMHSAVTFMTAANSLGWVCRPMAIPRHSLNEIWSNQHRKWITFDPTSNYYPEKNGVPLNTYEYRQAMLREGGGVMRARLTDEGLEKSPQSDSYGQRLLFVGYIPNTDHFDRGPDYGNDKFFITKDELCEGRSWHTRDCPENPAVDPYFPVNQAALALVPDGQSVKVTLGTMTPNFQEFHVRMDGSTWAPCEPSFGWRLHEGQNRLEAKSVNRFGVDGPISTVVLDVSG